MQLEMATIITQTHVISPKFRFYCILPIYQFVANWKYKKLVHYPRDFKKHWLLVYGTGKSFVSV